ncbi:G-protein coupled receptor 161-like isoform X2 [Acanthaster planci]|uniref:G-protein coupled receptor 161-like isoform X2 n=1 Tax=Acanthaster planci TaxID=133434 RepID=A0A8B7Y746_ACAPL|nr:G-protein coupled receptor 161-like isoform X2 [Acanthaster planci]
MVSSDTDSVNSSLVSPVPRPDGEGPDVATTVVQATFLGLILLAVCFLNFLVTFTIYKKASYLLTSSNRFILSLALSNFVAGAVVLPFNLISCVWRDWIFGVMWCNLTGFVTVSITTGSLFTVMIITIDRYFAISQPMMYPVKLTSTRTVELIILAWFLAVACSLPPVFGWSEYQYSVFRSSCLIDWSQHPSYAVFFTVACVLIPFLVILGCYLKILQVAHVTHRRVSNGNVVITGNLRNRRRSRRTSLLVNIRMSSPPKALRTIAITVGAFLVIWGPVTAELLFEAFHGLSAVPPWVLMSVTLLWYASFIMYPCVYAVWNRSIRGELLSWFCTRGRWLNDEQPLLFAPRKESRAVSISGSITDLSYTATLQSKAHMLGAASIATGTQNSSNDSGTVLTCIEETDDQEVDGGGELILRPRPKSLIHKKAIPRVNQLQTIVDVHTPMGYVGGSEDSLKSSDKEDDPDEGILEDA